MSKKITSLAVSVVFLLTPLVVSAQTFTIPQLPSNPTLQDLENEIQALTQIIAQLVVLHHTYGSTWPNTHWSPTSTPPVHFTNGTLAVSPAAGPAPLTVTFTGSVPGTSYTLDFGDGSVPINGAMNYQCPITNQNCTPPPSTINVQHTYLSQGQYRPTVRSGERILSAVVNVTGTSTQSTSSSITATPSSGPAPLTVTFSGIADAAAYSIDFGDGNSSGNSFTNSNCPAGNPTCTSSVSALHVYSTAGTYAVTLYKPLLACLSIFGGCGQGITLATTSVMVSTTTGPTSGSFTATPLSGPAPLTVTFTGSVPNTSYTLDFGDGSVPIHSVTNYQCPITNQNCTPPPSTINVQHTYASPGEYRIYLTSGNQILAASILVTSTYGNPPDGTQRGGGYPNPVPIPTPWDPGSGTCSPYSPPIGGGSCSNF